RFVPSLSSPAVPARRTHRARIAGSYRPAVIRGFADCLAPPDARVDGGTPCAFYLAEHVADNHQDHRHASTARAVPGTSAESACRAAATVGATPVPMHYQRLRCSA